MTTKQPRRGTIWQAALVAIPVLLGIIAACGSDDDSSTADKKDSTTTTTEPEDLEMQADDFVSLKDMTPVRGFFVDNPLGHLDEAVAVAEDLDGGGEYPVGTVIQLIPFEAMVKRAPGFDNLTNNWEFFSLEVSAEGTKIVTRGSRDVINQFGGNCFDCHSRAKPEFDFICEKDHGCDPLPIGDDVIHAVQEGDPRPARSG
ncbi:MAG TPA: hypothetical protein VGJ86_19795 [Acidimicrobiales bacterium]|jgi:hypothetical protein